MTEKVYFTVKETDVKDFKTYLYERENAETTISKYSTDLRCFLKFLGNSREVDKARLLAYKEWLIERYAVSSVNSMLAALNQFLEFCGYAQLKVSENAEKSLPAGRKGTDKEGIPKTGPHGKSGRKSSAGAVHGSDCRHRSPGQRIEIFYCRAGEKRAD